MSNYCKLNSGERSDMALVVRLFQLFIFSVVRLKEHNTIFNDFFHSSLSRVSVFHILTFILKTLFLNPNNILSFTCILSDAVMSLP